MNSRPPTHHSQFYSLETGSLSEPRAEDGGQQAPVILLSPLPATLQLNTHTGLHQFQQAFYTESENWDAALACTASALSG